MLADATFLPSAQSELRMRSVPAFRNLRERRGTALPLYDGGLAHTLSYFSLCIATMEAAPPFAIFEGWAPRTIVKGFADLTSFSFAQR
jgi:hypothetical protein